MGYFSAHTHTPMEKLILKWLMLRFERRARTHARIRSQLHPYTHRHSMSANFTAFFIVIIVVVFFVSFKCHKYSGWCIVGTYHYARHSMSCVTHVSVCLCNVWSMTNVHFIFHALINSVAFSASMHYHFFYDQEWTKCFNHKWEIEIDIYFQLLESQ